MGLSAFGIFELLFRLKLLFRFASLAVPNGHRHRPLPASSNICNHQGLSAWSMPSPRGRCVLCFVLDYIRLHSCFTFCCNCLWFVVVQSLRDVQLFATPRTAAHQSPLSSRLLGFAQIHVPWVGDANCLTLCCPLFLFLQSFPSIRFFSSELAFRITWPKYCSFSFSITPSDKYSGLISFRIDWFVLLAVHGTLKSLLQHHSSKASILWCSAFFTVQPSHPYMTTGKTVSLTRQTFVGKVMSLLLNMLPRVVITFLPRSKHLLISWLQSPSAVILEPPKIKSDTFHCFSLYFPWSDGTRCHDLTFLNVEL